jgi:type II secretory pathway predicted ATPase ExeA
MLRLKAIVARLSAQGAGSQATLAAALDLNRTRVAQWLNHEQWPPRRDRAALCRAVRAWLAARGATAEELAGWESALPAEQAARLLGPGRGRGRGEAGARGAAGRADDTTEDTIMLLRGQRLSPRARALWGLGRDPFREEIRSGADLYLTPDMRYCREAMRATAEHGGMTAIVGESGSGKTTLRDDLHDWIASTGKPITLIEPYVIDMEERGGRRRTLPAREIAAAILHTLAPHERVRQDSQARFRQVHERLADSHRTGRRHCLLIEEAHDLPTPTLRHLKRYLELRAGHVPLLSVLLLGQPELGYRLSELDASIREIVQRCEVVTLQALDAHMVPYLRHKLGRAGAALEAIADAEALEGLRERLTQTPRSARASAATVSLCYPLACANLLTAAMNRAAELGLERVTADVLAEV